MTGMIGFITVLIFAVCPMSAIAQVPQHLEDDCGRGGGGDSARYYHQHAKLAAVPAIHAGRNGGTF